MAKRVREIARGIRRKDKESWYGTRACKIKLRLKENVCRA